VTRYVIAILAGLLILWVGATLVRAVASMRPREHPDQPEDVSSLDVVFVCGECGTEFRVERLGELQVPRHCGEPMRVEQRPAPRR
jgi:hypothetical protein